MQIVVWFLLFEAFIVHWAAPRNEVRELPEGEYTFVVGPDEQVEVYYIIKPSSEILKERVIKQAHDFSCGSAALATLLNYYLGEELSERQVIRGLLEYGDRDRIAERRAFSLLDMKKFVNVLGYKGVGYRAEIEDLKTLETPGILPLKIAGYRHFVVFKGIYDGHVFVADPSRGNISFSLPEFRDMWYENVLLVVYPEGAEELDALRLREVDLRYIDEETLLEILFDHEPIISRPEELRMELVPTQEQYYDN
jgi:predicted double-glycine peptidase